MLAFYQGKSLVSRLIRWFTWSRYSHVAWLCRDGSVIEAWHRGGVQRHQSLAEVHTPGTRVEIFKVLTHEGHELNNLQLGAIEQFLAKQIGNRYDFWGILGFLTRARMEAHNAWFCSELVFAALRSVGVLPLERVAACKVTPGLLSFSPLLRWHAVVTLKQPVEHDGGRGVACLCALGASALLIFSGCASVLINQRNQAAEHPLKVGVTPAGVEVGFDLFQWRAAAAHPWQTLLAAGADSISLAALVKVAKDWYDRRYGSDGGAPTPTATTIVNNTINVQDNHGTITVPAKRKP
jgi:hypothetical protein